MDLTAADSLPEMPTFTDTLVVDTIVTFVETESDIDETPEETQIRTEIDTLYWGRDSQPLERFYEKLDRV